MQTHVLTITYSGLLADEGGMDAALAKRTMRGARRLLSASAFYYTQGYLPARLLTRTNSFQIIEFAPERGSLTRDLLIGIAGSGIYDVAKVHFPDVLIVAVALSAAGLLSVKKERWVELGKRVRALTSPDEPTRIEPVLPMPDCPRVWAETAVPSGVDRDQTGAVWQPPEVLVVSRTREAIEDLLYPTEQGGALSVEIRLNGEMIISVGIQRAAAPSQTYLEDELLAAIRRLRGSRG